MQSSRLQSLLLPNRGREIASAAQPRNPRSGHSSLLTGKLYVPSRFGIPAAALGLFLLCSTLFRPVCEGGITVKRSCILMAALLALAWTAAAQTGTQAQSQTSAGAST